MSSFHCLYNVHLSSYTYQDKDYIGLGTSDGLFQEWQYFKCRPDCGMFVSLEKLSRPQVYSHTQPPSSGQRFTSQSKDRGTSSSVKSSSDPLKHKYTKGDRVVVFTEKGVPVHGVVKWVGMYSYTISKKQVSFKAVGIETVSIHTCMLISVLGWSLIHVHRM